MSAAAVAATPASPVKATSITHAMNADAAAAAAAPAVSAPQPPPAVPGVEPPVWSSDLTLDGVRVLMSNFAAERGWAKYHTPRNLTLALVGEIGELAELFQWRGEVSVGVPEFTDRERTHLGEELSDCLLYLIRLAERCSIDLPRAVLDKMKKNAAKYPAEAAYGKSQKYTAYQTAGATATAASGDHKSAASAQTILSAVAAAVTPAAAAKPAAAAATATGGAAKSSNAALVASPKPAKANKNGAAAAAAAALTGATATVTPPPPHTPSPGADSPVSGGAAADAIADAAGAAGAGKKKKRRKKSATQAAAAAAARAAAAGGAAAAAGAAAGAFPSLTPVPEKPKPDSKADSKSAPAATAAAAPATATATAAPVQSATAAAAAFKAKSKADPASTTPAAGGKAGAAAASGAGSGGRSKSKTKSKPKPDAKSNAPGLSAGDVPTETISLKRAAANAAVDRAPEAKWLAEYFDTNPQFVASFPPVQAADDLAGATGVHHAWYGGESATSADGGSILRRDAKARDWLSAFILQCTLAAPAHSIPYADLTRRIEAKWIPRAFREWAITDTHRWSATGPGQTISPLVEVCGALSESGALTLEFTERRYVATPKAAKELEIFALKLGISSNEPAVNPNAPPPAAGAGAPTAAGSSKSGSASKKKSSGSTAAASGGGGGSTTGRHSKSNSKS